MAVEPATYAIGPADGRVLLRTFRQGIAAKVGHDLVIEARAWNGTVTVPTQPEAAPAVTAEIDLRELHVVEGTGGVKPLTDRDKREIDDTMQKQLRTRDHATATFRSSAAQALGDGRVLLEGQLTLMGQTHPIELVVQEHEGGVSGSATVTQTLWGIKPYTGFFGALKLRDAVDVEVTVTLRPLRS